MTSCGLMPAARRSRTPVAPSAFDSLRPSASRTSRWCANVGGSRPPEQTSEPDLDRRRGEEVAAAYHEVDVLAQVVHDHGERVRPVARRGHAPGGRRRPPRRPSTVRRGGPSRPRIRRRARHAAPVRRVRVRDSRPGSPARATDGRARRPTARRSTASSRSRRPGPHHARRSSAAAYGASSSDWRTGPSSAANPSQARSSSRAASYSGRQRTRSWSSMRSRTRAAGLPRHAPDPDRVRDVAEVEIAGRCRREACSDRGRRGGHEVTDARRLRLHRPHRCRPAPGRAPRARGSRSSAVGRERGGRPGRAAPGWPSSPGAGPRARAPRHGWCAGHRGSSRGRRPAPAPPAR